MNYEMKIQDDIQGNELVAVNVGRKCLFHVLVLN